MSPLLVQGLILSVIVSSLVYLHDLPLFITEPMRLISTEILNKERVEPAGGLERSIYRIQFGRSIVELHRQHTIYNIRNLRLYDFREI
jgi:hypothetical protein